MKSFDLEEALDLADAQPLSRRAALIRSAEKLFAERGYERVTVRDIADDAGVNVATLHLHWKSKATLYEAVCRAHARYLLSFVARLQGDSASGEISAGQRIERFVDHVIALLIERPTVAPMALESVSGQAPPDLSTLFQHDVAVFELAATEMEKLLPDDEGQEAMLTLLAFFYMGIVTFTDSPLQQALLGGSVYESPLRERVKKFAKIALPRLLGIQSGSSR